MLRRTQLLLAVDETATSRGAVFTCRKRRVCKSALKTAGKNFAHEFSFFDAIQGIQLIKTCVKITLVADFKGRCEANFVLFD